MELERILRGFSRKLIDNCLICNREVGLLRNSVPLYLDDGVKIVHRYCLKDYDLDSYSKSLIKKIEDDGDHHMPHKIVRGEYFYIFANYINGIGLSKSWLYLPRSTMIEYDEGRVDLENPYMISNVCSLIDNTPNLFFFLKCLSNGKIIPNEYLHKDSGKIKNEDCIPEVNIKCFDMVENYLEVLLTTGGLNKQTLFLLDKDIEMMKNTDFKDIFDVYNKIEWKTMREIFEEDE
ncbi:MAG TPA: hypothetical protein VF941_22510 [Clostridia bacterium]